MHPCPECGAKKDCQAAFDACLVREFTDPGFGNVHHLTVAAYMLQHSSRLSRDGWLHMRQLLRGFLIEGRRPQDVRAQDRGAVDSGRRIWKIKSPDGLPFVSRRAWTSTISEIRMDSPAVYSAGIKAWARAVLEDCEAVTW